MQESWRCKWGNSLDKSCAVLGGGMPLGIVIGNVGFEAMLSLVAVLWIARTLILKENPLSRFVKDPFVLPWLFLYAAVLLSLTVNGPGVKGVAHDIVFVRHLLFLMALIDISKRIAIERYFLIGMGASVLLAACNLLLAHGIGYDLMGKPAARYTSKLKEAARIAGLFSYLSPMLVAWAFSLPFLSKRARGIMLLAGLTALLLMYQMGIRTAILATGAGFSFWVCYLFFKRFSTKALGVIIPVILLAAGASLFYVQRQPMASMYDRASMYKTTWALILDHPVLGVGVSGYQNAFADMAASGRVAPFVAPDGTVWLTTEAMHAHNLVLMVLACIGVVGLIALLWLLFNIFRVVYTRSEPRYRDGLVVWPVVFVVISLTNLHFFGDWYHALFVYLTAFTGVLRRPKQSLAVGTATTINDRHATES
jgi:O-antigen ligase